MLLVRCYIIKSSLPDCSGGAGILGRQELDSGTPRLFWLRALSGLVEDLLFGKDPRLHGRSPAGGSESTLKYPLSKAQGHKGLCISPESLIPLN